MRKAGQPSEIIPHPVRNFSAGCTDYFTKGFNKRATKQEIPY